MDFRWIAALVQFIITMMPASGTKDKNQILVEDQSYWIRKGNEELSIALNVEQNKNVAKNVIIFIGDGMGLSTITASRILGKTETGYLSFDKFPHIGTLKTYSANNYVPDSCSTATAMFCGIKANQRTGGLDASVKLNDCNASLNSDSHVQSIMTWAQAAGKATGFVTTTRVTHATPAALYAHTPNRYWECEAFVPSNSSACKDIAKQLVEDYPGRNFNVIMGGGRQMFQSDVQNRSKDIIDTWGCYSKDGRNLMQAWANDKIMRNESYQVLEDTGDLLNMKLTKYTLGIFANGHMNLDYERDRSTSGMPSLVNMTEAAIKLLKQNDKGYVIMIEGGLIDFAHHRGKAKKALSETLVFSDAVERALTMIDPKETLVIVTSDHSHPLVISGYAERGTKITGIAQKSKIDNIPYTSLLYGIGGENNYKYSVINETVMREDPSNIDTDDFEYSQQAGVKTAEVTHDGSDVLVYAQGPFAHLFHTVHEQTYVAYVIAYAAKMGPYRNDRRVQESDKSTKSTATAIQIRNVYLLCSVLLINWLMLRLASDC